MKMKAAHYVTIRDAFTRLARLSPTVRRLYRESGNTETRFLWDAFRAAMIEDRTEGWIARVLNAYLNDSHIETALRKAADEAWPMD